MARGLSPKQIRFVKEYLIDSNLTQAAIRAGYSKKGAQPQASRMLLNVMIRKEIEKGLTKKHASLERKIENVVMTQAEWLTRLTNLANSDITDFLVPGEDGKLRMSMDHIKKSGLGKIVRKMKMLPGGKVEIDLRNNQFAFELIAKHFGWIKDQVEHSGTITNSQLVENDFKKIFESPEVSRLALELAEATSKPSSHQEAVKAPEKGKS